MAIKEKFAKRFSLLVGSREILIKANDRKGYCERVKNRIVCVCV